MKISEDKLDVLHTMPDENLLKLCAKFGARALKWRRRFIGLLPEVQKRRLFEKKGFNSIFEFAYKLAGLSEKQVRVVLNLSTRFEDKPTLKGILESGEASVNKLTRVASIATQENEEELAEKVMVLPKGALDTFVKDVKILSAENGGQNGLSKTLFHPKSLPGQTLDFEISDEVAKELNHLNFQGHDVNKIILELLEKRKAEIIQKKQELAQEAIERRDTKKEALEPGAKLKISSYIPVKIQTVLKEEYGEKCSIPHCCKSAKGDHHSQRLALVGLHDPRYIAPMCKEHHQIAHLIDQKYRNKSSGPGMAK